MEVFSSSYDLPSGQGVVDQRSSTSTAKGPSQNEIFVKAHGVRDHAKECHYVRDQKNRWPEGEKQDMDICQGDYLFVYNAPSQVSTTTSENGTETKVFPALNGAPKGMQYSFGGSAASTFVAGDLVKNPLLTVQKSGYKVGKNTGNQVIRPGDYVRMRSPNMGSHGFHNRGPSGTRIMPETVPLRFDTKDQREFSQKLVGAIEYIDEQLASNGNVANELQNDKHLTNRNVVGAVRSAFGNGSVVIQYDAFTAAVDRDAYMIRCAIENDLVTDIDKCLDRASNGYTLGAKYFLWLLLSVVSHVSDVEKATIYAFKKQTEFIAFVQCLEINERRNYVMGQCLNVSQPGGEMHLYMGKNF